MAVCSFAGHKEVYDADMASKMQTEVDRLVKENDAVEFLVYPVYPSGMLSYFFLLAALKARTQYPQKVTITCVIYHGPEAEMSGEDLTYSYMSDKVITIDLENTKKRDPTIGYKRMLKWISQNSTHLITYFYDTIYDPGNHLGKIPETLEIISLTTHETETAMGDSRPVDTTISRLREKIEDVPSRPKIIVARRGRGYVFTGKT